MISYQTTGYTYKKGMSSWADYKYSITGAHIW